jgi:hypothetical protein
VVLDLYFFHSFSLHVYWKRHSTFFLRFSLGHLRNDVLQFMDISYDKIRVDRL